MPQSNFQQGSSNWPWNIARGISCNYEKIGGIHPIEN